MKKRREELGLSLQELEISSNIPRRGLDALENDQCDYFAAESYYCGFLRNYAENLKLDSQILLNAYQNVKIIECPLPMEQLAGNVPKSRRPLLGIVLLVLLGLLVAGATGVIVYFRSKNTGVGTTGGLPPENTKPKVVSIDRYPWMQDLSDGLILQLMLDPQRLLQLRLQVTKNSYGIRLRSLEQDYDLILAPGKTNILRFPLAKLSRGQNKEDGIFRFDFTLQDEEADGIPTVLIRLNRAKQDETGTQSYDFPEKELSVKFQAFEEQNKKPVPHAILQTARPISLQVQLIFQRDNYIRYQWFGQEAQEFPVLKNKRLLLQGEAPLTLWLSDVNATKIKVNGQDLIPAAFQNVFIGRLEWKREASIARLYLTPGTTNGAAKEKSF